MNKNSGENLKLPQFGLRKSLINILAINPSPGDVHVRHIAKLKMTDSQALLAEYVKNGSEPAFRELVGRYVGLVYCTALRLVGGDTHLAEDVAQIVFADLARTARTLSQDALLGGWLHRDACFVAPECLQLENGG